LFSTERRESWVIPFTFGRSLVTVLPLILPAEDMQFAVILLCPRMQLRGGWPFEGGSTSKQFKLCGTVTRLCRYVGEAAVYTESGSQPGSSKL
jgi:hypothetical protein